jgi:DNA-binding GntR family transcriptional regulator
MDPRAYRRLATLIRQQISDGTLQPGQSAPSITSLSQEHGHARETCSKALRMLVFFTDRQRVRLVAELRR